MSLRPSDSNSVGLGFPSHHSQPPASERYLKCSSQGSHTASLRAPCNWEHPRGAGYCDACPSLHCVEGREKRSGRGFGLPSSRPSSNLIAMSSRCELDISPGHFIVSRVPPSYHLQRKKVSSCRTWPPWFDSCGLDSGSKAVKPKTCYFMNWGNVTVLT